MPSKASRVHQILEQLGNQEVVHLPSLLNLAVSYLEPDEVYCEIGCGQGALLAVVLRDRPDVKAYAVSGFQNYSSEIANQLFNTLEEAQLDDRVLVCEQDALEFLLELRHLQPEEAIGVCCINLSSDRLSSDYRFVLMTLLLAEPLLGDRSLLVLHHNDEIIAAQAVQDFLMVSARSRLLLELPEIWLLSFGNHSESTFNVWLQSRSNQDAISHVERVENSFQEPLENLYDRAVELHQDGKLDDAEVAYRQVLNLAEDRFEVWLNFGILCYMKEHYNEALQAFVRAMNLDNSNAIVYYNLGLVLEAVKRNNEAIAVYRKAISLDEKYIDAYNNLGNLLFEDGYFDLAKDMYSRAIAINHTYPGSYVNLGNFLFRTGYVEEAIETYQTALKYALDNTDVRENLETLNEARQHPASIYCNAANTFYGQQKFWEALPRYRICLEVQYLETLGFLFITASSTSCNQQVIFGRWWFHKFSRYPELVSLYKNFIQCLREENYTQDAIEAANIARTCFPEMPLFTFLARLSLPIFYEKDLDIEIHRQRFQESLQELIDEMPQLDVLDNDELDRYEQALNSVTNFHLSYQGRNDVDLQRQYGEFIHQLLTTKYPDLIHSYEPSLLVLEEKVRVGFVSPHMKAHSLGELYAGWLRYYDRESLEVYCYYLGNAEDSLTQEFRDYSHAFHKVEGAVGAIAKQILADRLHIAIFPAIGLEAKTIQLAALKLAPVQCTTWAHPVTSGLPTVDYFLSSQLMEPPNGQEHYTESLILLDNLGFSYPQPKLPPLNVGRDFFGLREDSIVYLACQNLIKNLPQYDRIYVDILSRVPRSQIAFISSPSPRITEQFRLRLARTFDQFQLDMNKRCVIVPRLSEHHYLCLNLLSDIFLDSFAWSGGITTLKAIACGLPVVTRPGDLMRARHSYAILQMLGITETIADTEATYIEIAVRLGLDLEWRQQIRERIEQNRDRLYDDRECIRAFEQFCRAMVYRAQE